MTGSSVTPRAESMVHRFGPSLDWLKIPLGWLNNPLSWLNNPGTPSPVPFDPRRRIAVRLLCSLLCLASIPALAAKPAPPDRWIGTWGASPVATLNPAGTFGPQAVAESSPAGITIRQTVHTSLGGPLVRIVLTNEFGTEALVIGSVHAALSAGGPTIQLASANAVTFHHQQGVTIAPGAIAKSDEFALALPPLSDLTISIFLPDQPIHTLSQHSMALATGYLVGGNEVGARTLPSEHASAPASPTAAPSNKLPKVPASQPLQTIQSWDFLKCVDVLLPGSDRATASAGAIVAFGDSITDGAQSSLDGNARWPDFLARRLYQADPHVSTKPGRPQSKVKAGRFGILNEGISGNKVLSDGAGESASARFERDVLAQAGVRSIVVLEGINDLGEGGPVGTRDITGYDQKLIAAFGELVKRAHAKGLKIFFATLTPYAGASYDSPEGETMRQTVNTWIQTNTVADGAIDFAKAIADPQNPLAMLPADDSGDHLHPSDAGYKAMAGSIDLKLFAR